jgi:hypothetical protein
MEADQNDEGLMSAILTDKQVYFADINRQRNISERTNTRHAFEIPRISMSGARYFHERRLLVEKRLPDCERVSGPQTAI